MEQYINKSALIAEIERRIKERDFQMKSGCWVSSTYMYEDLLDFINTLEVKEEILDKEGKTNLMQKCVREAYKRGYDMGVLQTTNKINHNMKEVDLEKEAENFVQTGEFVKNENPVLAIATHFFELGLRTQKGE